MKFKISLFFNTGLYLEHLYIYLYKFIYMTNIVYAIEQMKISKNNKLRYFVHNQFYLN